MHKYLYSWCDLDTCGIQSDTCAILLNWVINFSNWTYGTIKIHDVHDIDYICNALLSCILAWYWKWQSLSFFRFGIKSVNTNTILTTILNSLESWQNLQKIVLVSLKTYNMLLVFRKLMKFAFYDISHFIYHLDMHVNDCKEKNIVSIL